MNHKRISFVIFIVMLSCLAPQLATADKAIYVYVNSLNIDQNYITALSEVGFIVDTVIYHDLNEVNLSKYNLMIVNDELFQNPGLIPVNNFPSLIVNTYHLNDWGWSDYVSSVVSSQQLKVQKATSNSWIVQGMPDVVEAYTQCCYDTSSVNLKLYYLPWERAGQSYGKATSIKTQVAPNADIKDTVIGITKQGDILRNGIVVNKRGCFFGIVDNRGLQKSSDYWTDWSKLLFKRCAIYAAHGMDNDNDSYHEDTDCSDNDAGVNPKAIEVPYNGRDDDCNPATRNDDLDIDGYNSTITGGKDCNDNNSRVNPGMSEIVYNRIDDDCNPLTKDDDLDLDGYNSTITGGKDCKDNNSAINPSAVEICNGVDDNCDGIVDRITRNCSQSYIGECALGTESCTNGTWVGCRSPRNEDCDDLDNDCDGNVDESCLLNDAACIDISAPDSMIVGRTQMISVTMLNNGTDAWNSTSFYKLGSQNPADNIIWGINRANITAGVNVPTGQQHTFAFNITAPTTPSKFNSDWKMIHEGVGWFGGTCQKEIYVRLNCKDNDKDGFYGFNAIECPNGNDCDESNGNINPNATEACNGIDDNCNGNIDEGGNALCDDGQYCDGQETCNGIRGCIEGPDPSLSDNVGCTNDICDEVNDRIIHTPNNELCNDRQFCNGVEICNASVGCQGGTPVDCADAFACTTDSCNENINSCQHTPNNALCSDGIYCNGAEACDSTEGCKAGTNIDCSALNNNCNDGICNENSNMCEAQSKPDGTICDDGMFCSINDECRSGHCVRVNTRNCSENNLFAIATCNNNPDNNSFTWDTAPGFTSSCDETNNRCTIGNYTFTYTCSMLKCGADCEASANCVNKCSANNSIRYYNSSGCNECSCNYKTENCNDYDNWYYTGNTAWNSSDPCKEREQREQEYRDYSCSPSECVYNVTATRWEDTGGARNKPDGISCNDGAFCTTNDKCAAGTCTGSPIDCSGLNDQCNTGVCDETSDKCIKDPTTKEGASCNDGLYCTMNDECLTGSCIGTARNCDDAISCTQDSCNDQMDKCEHTANNGYCGDGVFCNGQEICSPTAGCQAGTAIDCSALNDPCNAGVCNDDKDMCVKDPTTKEGATCNDGLFCTINDECITGDCTGTSPKDCSDAFGCTIDSCNEQTDICDHISNNTYCSDGIFCNGAEICDMTIGCKSGALVDCSAFNLQAIATCNNKPDNNLLTWDMAAAYISSCDENADTCTQGSYTYEHVCDVTKCSAECDATQACRDTDCHEYNMCYDGTYREYSNTANSCLAGCTCTKNACTKYAEKITDNDQDGYDTECDNDCNDYDASIHPGAKELMDNIDQNCMNDAPTLLMNIPELVWDEDTSQTIDLSIYFDDADGDSLSFISTNPNNIQVVISGSHATLTSDKDWYGTRYVVFTASDGKASMSSNVVKITVNPINDAPTVKNIPDQTWSEDIAKILNLNDYFSDVDGDTLYYTSTTPTNINIEINGSSIRLIPQTNWHGTNSIVITADDHNGGAVSSNSINLIVNSINDPPVMDYIPDMEIIEGSFIKILPGASDVDGDTITFIFTQPLNSNGEWQTEFNDAGTYKVTVTAMDGRGGMDSQQVTIIVKEAGNHDPVIDHIPPVTVVEGELVKIVPHATDLDYDALTYSFTSPLNSKGEWQTTYTDSGTYIATVSVSDGFATNSTDVLINVLESGNHAPVIKVEDVYYAFEGQKLKITLSAYDPDKDPFTITYSALLDSNGEWQTKKGDKGTYYSTIAVSDGTAVTTVRVKIIVSEPPFSDIYVGGIKIFNEMVTPGTNLEMSISFSDSGNIDLKGVSVAAYIPELGVYRKIGPFNLKKGIDITKELRLLIPYDTKKGEYTLKIVISNDNVRREKYRTFTVV